MEWKLHWFIYKHMNKHEKMWEHNSQSFDKEEKQELHSIEKPWLLRSELVKCHLMFALGVSVNWKLIDSEVL